MMKYSYFWGKGNHYRVAHIQPTVKCICASL